MDDEIEVQARGQHEAMQAPPRSTAFILSNVLRPERPGQLSDALSVCSEDTIWDARNADGPCLLHACRSLWTGVINEQDEDNIERLQSNVKHAIGAYYRSESLPRPEDKAKKFYHRILAHFANREKEAEPLKLETLLQYALLPREQFSDSEKESYSDELMTELAEELPEAVALMLKLGADPNTKIATEAEQQNALQYCMTKNYYASFYYLLIAGGALSSELNKSTDILLENDQLDSISGLVDAPDGQSQLLSFISGHETEFTGPQLWAMTQRLLGRQFVNERMQNPNATFSKFVWQHLQESGHTPLANRLIKENFIFGAKQFGLALVPGKLPPLLSLRLILRGCLGTHTGRGSLLTLGSTASLGFGLGMKGIGVFALSSVVLAASITAAMAVAAVAIGAAVIACTALTGYASYQFIASQCVTPSALGEPAEEPALDPSTLPDFCRTETYAPKNLKLTASPKPQ